MGQETSKEATKGEGTGTGESHGILVAGSLRGSNPTFLNATCRVVAKGYACKRPYKDLKDPIQLQSTLACGPSRQSE